MKTKEEEAADYEKIVAGTCKDHLAEVLQSKAAMLVIEKRAHEPQFDVNGNDPVGTLCFAVWGLHARLLALATSE